jgi:hypothetical protein
MSSIVQSRPGTAVPAASVNAYRDDSCRAFAFSRIQEEDYMTAWLCAVE